MRKTRPRALWTGGRELDHLWIGVMYESPWEHLMTRLWGIDPVTSELKFDAGDGRLIHKIRDRLACFCDVRDAAWRARWVRRGCDPPKRWKRHTKPAPEESHGSRNPGH